MNHDSDRKAMRTRQLVPEHMNGTRAAVFHLWRDAELDDFGKVSAKGQSQIIAELPTTNDFPES